jgi:hypothetical protein
MATPKTQAIAELDGSMPAAAHAKPGQTLQDILDAVKQLAAKLDTDAGVTDANYSSTLAPLLRDVGAR